MARVEKTIDVAVPVTIAYNQWTQFAEFPNFMEGVEEVQQLDDRRLHWRATIGGKREEWEAEIREQLPDQRIIWRNTSGAENAGMVTFDALEAGTTRVHLEMSYDPEGFVESVGDALGFVSRRIEGDLRRFKEFIEARGSATGGWRGEIHNADAPGGHTGGSPEWGSGPLPGSDKTRAAGIRSAAGSGTGYSGEIGGGLESGSEHPTPPGRPVTGYPEPPASEARFQDGAPGPAAHPETYPDASRSEEIHERVDQPVKPAPEGSLDSPDFRA